MKTNRYIILPVLLLLMAPAMAQEDDPVSAAGYDFYFTLLDHWNWSGNSDAQGTRYCGVSVCSTEDGDITFSIPLKTGEKQMHFDAYTNVAASFRNTSDAVLKGVHIHSTGACYIHVWAHGPTAGDETMILPKHLLGRQYMLQGMPGAMITDAAGIPAPTWSQFTVVGTADATNVTVTPRVQLRCVNRNNAVIPAGNSTSFAVQENEVLLFQPDDYTEDISGTLVRSNKAVAVFQGNNLTHIPSNANSPDYTWEQARPTDSWGKEFIVAMSGRMKKNMVKFTALHDNTHVYSYNTNGEKQLSCTLQAGESKMSDWNRGISEGVISRHWEADQPVCCYLYTTGSAVNDDMGDPSMTEIIPVDNMAKETRWMAEQVEDNSPYKLSMLVTMRQEDEADVLYNNYPLSAYMDGSGNSRTEKDGYVSYELGISAYVACKLSAEEGAGFSAYLLRTGKTAEASSFNLSLPYNIPPPDFCPDGALLFREDFGGNDPSDPVVSHTPVTGMSSAYTQIFDTATCKGYGNGCIGMGSGRYLVAKHGYRNSTHTDYSVWHVMDDHTSFGDTTTGYFLEIDGRETGNDVFYSTTMEGVCPGMELSFSAFVANVTTAGQYNAWRTGRGYVHPKLTFTITDADSGTEIAKYNTDTVAHDWSLFGVPNAWQQSAHWLQTGMKFTVPDNVSRIRLSICNNASGSTGNDFALDDIEIRLCMPPVTIQAPDTVCAGTKNIFRAVKEDGNALPEPLHYLWEFSADSISWAAVPEDGEQELKLKAKPQHTGWYRVTVYGDGSTPDAYCRVTSEPFRFYVIEDCPPVLCPEGILIDSPEGLCAGSELSFIVNLTPGHDPARLLIRISDAGTDTEVRLYDTGELPTDSVQAGTSLTVPEGVSTLRWSISDNSGTASGVPLPIVGTELRLCLEPVSIACDTPACRKKELVLHAQYDNYGILQKPQYQWLHSADGTAWDTLQTGSAKSYTIDTVHRSHEGWYIVQVADSGNIAMPHCRSVSEPFRLGTIYCNTATRQGNDTTVCDTLLPVTWRGHEWQTDSMRTDTLRDTDGDDSLYVHLLLQTRICCPETARFRTDMAVCDTLLPFVWFYRDTMALFTGTGEQEIAYPHTRWLNCTGEIHTLALDTFHCERLYPVIVNKYGWQLLLDHTALRRIFPDNTPVAYQWYKDSEAIPGATEDDYSEHNGLHGRYQLYVQLDGGKHAWSNILDITPSPAPQPVIRRVYNAQGIPVCEDDISTGIYIIVYQQGERIWTEKKNFRKN